MTPDAPMTIARAIEIYPETLIFYDTGAVPANAKLRTIARELRPVGTIMLTDLLFACQQIWLTISMEYMTAQTGRKP